MTPIPKNTTPFTFAELVKATAGRLVGAADADAVVGVVTDTRQALTGSAFLALSGEHFDGHLFVADALKAGAKLAIVERELDVVGAQLVVPSTRVALGQIASLHRKRWGRRVIAVAGSAGKTSSKNAIGAMLTEVLPGRVHMTPGNLNNEIGVPLVLLGLTREHTECVLEIGTNQTGEVARLVAYARPDISVLTLIDLEHSEGLGGLDAIEAEEGAVFHKHTRCGIGNIDDVRVARQLQRVHGIRLAYGFNRGADYRALHSEPQGTRGSRVMVERPGSELVEIAVPGLGRPGIYTALAALAVTEHIVGRPLLPTEVEAALTRAQSSTLGRAEICELDAGLLIIDDSYNANPASMRAAIETARDLAKQRGARLHLVLGEMRELGTFSEAEHVRLGEIAQAAAAHTVIAVGGDARFISERSLTSEPGQAQFVSDADDAVQPLIARFSGNDVVLVKGSRSVRTERVVSAIRLLKGSPS